MHNTPIYSLEMKRNESVLTRRKVFYNGRASSILPLFLRQFYGMERELSMVMLLAPTSQVTGLCIVGMGTLTAIQAHPREIFKAAVRHNAYSIIVGHNHPCGNADPSDEDREFHERLKGAADVMGIPLEDDIIIGEETYFSFREESEREMRGQLNKQRELAVTRAQKRIQTGTARRRDVVLLAADRLAMVPEMLQQEATFALEQTIQELLPIVETSDRIRRTTRQRAKELLELALDAKSKGVGPNFSRFLAVQPLEAPEPKTPTVPLIDFIELPGDKRRRRR